MTTSSLPVAEDGVRIRTAGQIDRVRTLSVADFYRDYYNQRGSKPVLFTGLFDACGPPDLWTDDHLTATVGPEPIEVHVSINGSFSGGRGPYDPEQIRAVQMPFSECLERMHGDPRHSPIIRPGEKYYVFGAKEGGNETVQKLLAGLREDPIYIPEQLRGTAQVRKNFWLGPPGNLTVPHFDRGDNLLAQARGRKRVFLWHPRQADLLYITPMRETHDRQSEVDVRDPDLGKHPRFARASAIEGVLGPGDVLFIPSGWIHCVVSLDFAVSVNMWWTDMHFGGFLPASDGKVMMFQYLFPIRPLRPELRSLMSYLIKERALRNARRVLGRP